MDSGQGCKPLRLHSRDYSNFLEFPEMGKAISATQLKSVMRGIVATASGARIPPTRPVPNADVAGKQHHERLIQHGHQ